MGTRRRTYALIELAPLASRDKAFAVGVPGHACQTVLVGLRHLGAQLPRLVKRREWRAEGRAWKQGKGEKKKTLRAGEGKRERKEEKVTPE